MSDINSYAAQGYAAAAGAYAKGRPDYPPEVATWLRTDLGLGTGKTALDLGAGTGKFLPHLRATDATAIAVEPVEQMRGQLMADYPGVDVREGSAERIPLEDGAADAVVCAQSFHWFATKAALAEIRRVLKPDGMLGLIWNVRDESVPWVAELTAIMTPYEGVAPRYRTLAWREPFPADGFGPLAEWRFPHGHTGAPDDVIVDRILSVSFIAALPSGGRDQVRAQLHGLIDATPGLAGKSQVTFPYVTTAYHCRRRG